MDKIFTLLSRQMKSWWSIFIIYVNICTVFQEKFHDLHIAFKTKQNRILIDFPCFPKLFIEYTILCS